jgi:hypothetical protein
MTVKDKESIQYLRRDGLSYQAIADQLGLSLASVKSFCQRSGVVVESKCNPDNCQQCGKPLGAKLPGAEGKRFCSAACRMKWWNHHASLRTPKEKDRRVCSHCGNEFYSAKPRKHCGHPCYIAARFGGDRHDTRTV